MLAGRCQYELKFRRRAAGARAGLAAPRRTGIKRTSTQRRLVGLGHYTEVDVMAEEYST